MKVVAIIPARYGSTRLPGKPLKDINGKTMIERVYLQVAAAETVNEVIVATDDERIVEAVAAFGGSAVMTSPEHESGTERVAEVAADYKDTIVVNVQGDEPMIAPALIDDTVWPLLDDEELLMSSPMVRLEDPEEINDPNVVKVVTDSDGFAMYFSRSPIPFDRDGKGAIYYKHIGIYAYTDDFLRRIKGLPATPLGEAECLEQLRVLENGFNIKMVETEHDPVAVDTEEDLQKVISIIKKEEENKRE
ncbi:MAG: 3-deoxy-manno-octulosonate cytidylyltransferase [Deltaproteobacteria bacterium]|nr:3-deoxy-manno-octulosonate cytidylyltransferase [Deltaproteobacteria bacterium]